MALCFWWEIVVEMKDQAGLEPNGKQQHQIWQWCRSLLMEGQRATGPAATNGAFPLARPPRCADVHSHFHIASCATPGPRWTVSRLNMLATQAFQYVATLNVFRSKFPFLSHHSDVHLHWLGLGTKTTCLGWPLWLSWSRMETVWLPVEKSPQTQLRLTAGVIKNVQCYNLVGCNDVTTIHSSSFWCGMWLIII